MENSANQLQGVDELDGSPHIVLEAPEDEHNSSRRPENVAAHFELNSRIRGACVHLTLYEEGFVEIREQYRRGASVKRLLNLRYLDPKPKISRIFAPRLLYVALGLVSLTGVVGVLAWHGIMPVMTFSAVLLFGGAAAISAWLFFCRTGEQSIFHTATGRADVLTLFGTVGSIAALRRIVPALAAAVHSARDSGAHDKRLYLRQEIREHYRLTECGIISTDDCVACTQRILKQFD